MIRIPHLIPYAGSIIGTPVWVLATFLILMAMEGVCEYVM
jgi:hypothetical protein